MVNVISRLMWSNLNAPFTKDYLVKISGYVIIQLVLSLWVWPNVITLSGFFCTRIIEVRYFGLIFSVFIRLNFNYRIATWSKRGTIEFQFSIILRIAVELFPSPNHFSMFEKKTFSQQKFLEVCKSCSLFAYLHLCLQQWLISKWWSLLKVINFVWFVHFK